MHLAVDIGACELKLIHGKIMKICTKLLYNSLLLIVRGIILQCLFITIVSAGISDASKAQSIYEINLNLDLKKATLKQTIDRISEETDFHFAYNLTEMRKQKTRVTQQFSNESLGDILEYLSASYRVNFKRINETIHINTPADLMVDTVIVEKTMVARVISGVVKDDTGEALPGVNVYVKGTSIGTLTDLDGNYKLSVPDDATTLVFSYVGFVSEEVLLAETMVIDVTLFPDISTLSEVVVVGYGTTQRRDLTGSVVSVDLKGAAQAPNTNAVQALQGAMAGVNVGISTTPGSSPGISIRGQTSLSGSDYPLIVVDGIIFNGSMSDLNVNDIESIDVLKDASAAAIYGSRSANGVILVTTKKGKGEKPTFNFNAYSGFANLAPTKNKVMNGYQYAKRLVDYTYQSQELYPWYKTGPTSAEDRPAVPIYSDSVLAEALHSTEETENFWAGKETNWIDKVLRNKAKVQSYDLSVSGRSANTTYYLSGSYVDQDGLRVGDDFVRSTLRAKFTNDITDWLTLGLNTTYTAADYSGVAADVSEAMQASPWADFANEDGSYDIDLAGESAQHHPLSNTKADDENKRDDLFIIGQAIVKVPWVQGLTYEFNYSTTLINEHLYQFFPVTTLGGTEVNGYALRRHQQTRYMLLNNMVKYNRTFNDIHKVDVTLLASSESKDYEYSLLEGEGFDIAALGYDAIGLANNQYVTSSASETHNLGYMARVSYGLKNRYLLTGTVRRDGYSGFAQGHKIAVFKSGSFGWVLSEEDFVKNLNLVALDFLKLRFSYGENGNQDVGQYGSIAQAKTYFMAFGDEGDNYVAYRPTTLGNTDLTWETTRSYNLGLDFAVLADRISGSVDVYKAHTKDVLVSETLPRTSGFNDVLTNIGELDNKGIEITLKTLNVDYKGFRWESNFAFSLNRNTVVELYNHEDDIENGWYLGEPINALYGYHNLGTVYTEDEFFNGEVPEDFYPGDYKIEDIKTEDGHDMYNADDDRKILGTTDARFRASLKNTLSYKNFTLSFFLNSIQGGNNYYMYNPGNIVAGGTDDVIKINRSAVRRYWTPDHPTKTTPGIYHTQSPSGTYYLYRSFVRLQDVSLSYNVPSTKLERFGFNNLSLYLSGKNVAIWTNWTGWDPETTSTSTPISRTFILGINASF